MYATAGRVLQHLRSWSVFCTTKGSTFLNNLNLINGIPANRKTKQLRFLNVSSFGNPTENNVRLHEKGEDQMFMQDIFGLNDRSCCKDLTT